MDRLSREEALFSALPLLSPMMALSVGLLLRLVETVRGGCTTAEAEAAEEVSWLSLFVGGLMMKRRERNECQM